MERWGGQKEGAQSVSETPLLIPPTHLFFLAVWEDREEGRRGERQGGRRERRVGSLTLVFGQMDCPPVTSKFWVPCEAQVWVLFETLWDFLPRPITWGEVSSLGLPHSYQAQLRQPHSPGTGQLQLSEFQGKDSSLSDFPRDLLTPTEWWERLYSSPGPSFNFALLK